jgi:hypothetical protein
MSQTRKDIIAALDAETKAREQAEAAHAAQIKDLQGKLDAATTRAATAEQALVAEQTAHAATQKAAKDAADKAASDLAAATAAAEAEKTAHAGTQKALAAAKAGLANPAMIDAALKACGMDLGGTSEAEADRPEKSGSTDTAAAAEQAWLEQYQAAAPAERRGMWKQRQAALKKNLDASVEQENAEDAQ